MKHDDLPLSRSLPQRTDSRFCESAERCRRHADRVQGFADPRWDDALVRWCSMCRNSVVTGRV
jgi:hypothetical protein